MSTKKSMIAVGIILLAALAASLYAYPLLPAMIASHWGIDGQANGYMDKFWGVFLFPLIMLICAVLFFVIPKIDPLRENIAGSRKYYDGLIIIFLLFFLYMHCITISWNLGYRFNFTEALSPAFALLWFSMGMALPHIKRNWLIGIRTPWTLSDDHVWDATHKLGGRLFEISGALVLGGFLFPEATLWLVLCPIIISAIIVIMYSYFLYEKQHRG